MYFTYNKYDYALDMINTAVIVVVIFKKCKRLFDGLREKLLIAECLVFNKIKKDVANRFGNVYIVN